MCITDNFTIHHNVSIPHAACVCCSTLWQCATCTYLWSSIELFTVCTPPNLSSLIPPSHPSYFLPRSAPRCKNRKNISCLQWYALVSVDAMTKCVFCQPHFAIFSFTIFGRKASPTRPQTNGPGICLCTVSRLRMYTEFAQKQLLVFLLGVGMSLIAVLHSQVSESFE